MPELSSDALAQINKLPILIVEDNEINRMFLGQSLTQRGFSNLKAVATAEDALEALAHFQPELVILDVMLPGMDGLACCEEIRRREGHRELPILIQTTLQEPRQRSKAFEKGATDFVSKPVYPDELCARVRVHLERRYSLKALRMYKSRVENELEHARQLQLSILPSADEVHEVEQRCRLNIASYFRPSSEVGGDFWGMKSLFPHQTAFWMVDFSGHGVASALNAFRLQAYLKEHSPHAPRPGEYLSQLNDKMLRLLMRGQFATMFYGIVDTQGGQLLYACASTPHPIMMRHATGKAELLDGTGSPLGLGMAMYATQSVPFGPGDMLLLYSDALTETKNRAGHFISEEQVMALLEANAGASAEALRDKLLAFFADHAGGELRDDLTFTLCARSL